MLHGVCAGLRGECGCTISARDGGWLRGGHDEVLRPCLSHDGIVEIWQGTAQTLGLKHVR
jgi:hypothetical protein